MNDLRKAAEMALEALELSHPSFGLATEKFVQAIKTLRQALAESANSTTNLVEPKASSQTEQEPVACKHSRYSVDALEQTGNCYDCGAEGRMRFVVDDAPPKREWVGLTDEDKKELANKYKHIETGWRHDMDLIAEAEVKLKEKNA